MPKSQIENRTIWKLQISLQPKYGYWLCDITEYWVTNKLNSLADLDKTSICTGFNNILYDMSLILYRILLSGRKQKAFNKLFIALLRVFWFLLIRQTNKYCCWIYQDLMEVLKLCPISLHTFFMHYLHKIYDGWIQSSCLRSNNIQFHEFYKAYSKEPFAC